MIGGVLAQCTVTDLTRAEEWYTRLLDAVPDQRPMPGLLEWRLGGTFGIQVWVDSDRAGKCSIVLQESDISATAARLTAAGIDHDGARPGGGARILQLTDPMAIEWSSPGHRSPPCRTSPRRNNRRY